ncbi:TIGR03943 family putative permease subunit [Heyndrickxia sp. MSNUG]|uniref:TIGR03943 family putative permease subunit n=1 Tax=Heyndrickxia sp. MSNUG TaxID=3136677 RepID=UPI003C2CD831
MIRTLILMLFTYFFFHLHASGNLTKYINMKYSYLSYTAMWILGVLTVVQAYYYLKDSDSTGCSSEGCCNHDHDHDHEQNKPWYKRIFIYTIFIFPLISGFFFPIATLDSTIVKSKGFSFKALETNDQYAQTQYLKPDTSVYYGKEGYDELMNQELKNYIDKENIALKDKDFLKGMETIYQFPGEFTDKTIEFDGFAFKGESISKKQIFVLRFGVIHCIADSGAFGMLVEFPEETKIQDDQWLHVKGKLTTKYYQPFKANIPVLKVEKWDNIDQPGDPYTYRTY